MMLRPVISILIAGPFFKLNQEEPQNMKIGKKGATLSSLGPLAHSSWGTPKKSKAPRNKSNNLLQVWKNY